MTARFALTTGALLALVAVALGAFGAHALKGRLEPDMATVWQTAAQYHGWHALALVAAGLLLLHRPDLLFLDEPTAGIDPVARRYLWDLLFELSSAGHTLFVTTHYMDEAEYCDRISIMNEGRIVALDTPDGLKKQYRVDSVEEVFVKIVRSGKNSV